MRDVLCQESHLFDLPDVVRLAEYKSTTVSQLVQKSHLLRTSHFMQASVTAHEEMCNLAKGDLAILHVGR